MSGQRVDTADAETEVLQHRAPPGRHPLLHRLIDLGRVLVVVVVVLAVVYAVRTEWTGVSRTFHTLSWKSLVSAFAAIVLGMFATVGVWRQLLAAMGIRIPYWRAAQVNLIGQLGKYLPGSVWAFALQAQLGKRYGISRPRALVALLLSAGVSTVGALTLAVFAVPELARQWGSAAWLLCAGPLSLATLYPPLLTWIANLAMRLMRRPQLRQQLHGGQVLRALLWALVAWVLFGVQLWLLTGSLAGQPASALAITITTGAFALGMSAGFVAFVLPSGVGVREVVIVAGLAPITSAGTALALALVSRLLFTIADITTALGALVVVHLRGDRVDATEVTPGH